MQISHIRYTELD